MAKTSDLKQLVDNLISLNDDDLAQRVRVDSDVQWCLSELQDILAADVAPVVHGRWAHDHYQHCAEQFEIVRCTICGYKAYAEALHIMHGNYCPNCGAKMDQ